MTSGPAAIKRFLPRSLLGRSVLIIVMPLILLQAVALQIFYGTHWEVVSRRLAAAVAGDVELNRRSRAELDQSMAKLLRVLTESADARGPLRGEITKSVKEEIR